MEQRDLIKHEVERLGKVLGRILAELLGFDSNLSIIQGIEQSKASFKNEFDIDLDEFIQLNQSELMEYLDHKKIDYSYYEIFSHLLKEIGEKTLLDNPNSAKKYLTKSLELLELIDDISQTFSIDRMNRKSEIKSIFKNISQQHKLNQYES